MQEMFLNTLMKNIKIDDVLKQPNVAEGIALLRGIADDFKIMKSRLEKIERFIDQQSNGDYDIWAAKNAGGKINGDHQNGQ